MAAHPSADDSLAPAKTRTVVSLRHSLLRYSPALVLVAIAIADSSRYADPDLWGHLRFGLDFVALGHLIRHDPYSYSAPGHLWRDHEWLSEVLMALFYKALGVFGLKLMRTICTGVTIVFLAVAMGETGASTLIQFAILLVGAVAIAPQVQYRPQMFTFALLSVELALLVRYRCRGQAPLWFLLPLLALWANLHGGFIVGIAALGIFAGVVLLEDLYLGKGWRRGAALIGLTFAAALATLANPYGIGMWATVAHALRNPLTHRAVTDWHPLIFALVHQWRLTPIGTVYDVFALLLMAAVIWSVVRAPRRIDLPLTAIAVAMSAAALFAVRNLPLAVIGCSVALALNLPLAGGTPATESSAPRSSPLNQAILVAVALLLAADTGLFSSRLIEAGSYPAGAVAFMKAHGLKGNLLCDFDWGEYLIWHTAPASKVFIDGRYDTVYPKPVIQAYLDFRFGRPQGERVLSAYRNDFALVRPDSGAYRLVSQHRGWRLIYQDKTCALFAPTASSATALAAAPVTGHPEREYFPN